VTAPKLRVLVVEDSAFNRRALTDMLGRATDVEVIGRATDGDEGLRMALQTRPDAITLDLGLPGLDGFAFLRLLMAKAPTPVIVVSAYSGREDVFKAMELGAMDFIAKPTRQISKDFLAIQDELIDKVRAVRQARKSAQYPDVHLPASRRTQAVELRLAVVGASTGGPPAVEHLLAALPGELPLGVAIAQHMPAQFTRTFAERLDRLVHYQVREAKDGDAVRAGTVLVAPGGHHLKLVASGKNIFAALVARRNEKHSPSIDVLFESAGALAKQTPVIGVILTGMGEDGRRGARRLRDAGGVVLAESEESAVVFGMPRAAIQAGAVTRVLPLERIAWALSRFARGLGVEEEKK
jgi:two-component system chemotaxis response regulator CheB